MVVVKKSIVRLLIIVLNVRGSDETQIRIKSYFSQDLEATTNPEYQAFWLWKFD